MLEIKFRAWVEDYKEMAYSGQYNYLSHFFSYLEECYLETQYVIQQFTGLYDKNGKEIYKGDIVKTYQGFILTIVFEHGAFILKNKQETYSTLLGWQSDYESNEMDWTDLNDFEVIGNIYENPELLNEMK